MKNDLRLGVAFLAVASLCLVGGAVYLGQALAIQPGVTAYPPLSVVPAPPVSAFGLVCFVLLEHVLVGVGVGLVYRGAVVREAASAF